jgi:hypothetical protein
MQNEQTNRAEPSKTLPFSIKSADGYILRERRRRPTPGLSRYTFFGRRKRFSRESDHQKGGYIDHYSSKLFIALVAILGLNVLDVILTMVILGHSGFELNPVVRSAIEVYGDRFWVWKYGIVSACLLLLCLHIKFKGVRTIIILICSIYIAVVLYQTFLIIKHFPITFWSRASLGSQGRAEYGSCSATVFYDHRLAEAFGQSGGNDAAHQVGTTAGCERNNEPDCFGRVSIGCYDGSRKGKQYRQENSTPRVLNNCVCLIPMIFDPFMQFDLQ